MSRTVKKITIKWNHAFPIKAEDVLKIGPYIELISEQYDVLGVVRDLKTGGWKVLMTGGKETVIEL